MAPPRLGGVARQQHTSADCLQSWRCSSLGGLNGRYAGKRAAARRQTMHEIITLFSIFLFLAVNSET